MKNIEMIEPGLMMSEGVLSALQRGGFRCAIRLEGIGPALFRRRWEGLSTAIGNDGRQAILVDGEAASGSRGVLYQVILTWAQGQLSDESHRLNGQYESVSRLLDFVTAALDMGSEEVGVSGREELLVDGVIRLVEALVERQPAVVCVVAATQLSALEQKILRHLSAYYLADTIAGLAGGEERRSELGWVVVGEAELGGDVEVESLKMNEEAIEEIRRFLNDRSVLERLLASTEGDSSRLEALFDGIPASVVELWRRRFEELSGEAQQVLEILAVAGETLELGLLHRMTSASSVRSLLETDFVERSIRLGALYVGLASGEVSRGILELLGEDRRAEIHLQLARFALDSGGADAVFIARHALAGGDEAGQRFGLPAARQLLQRGQWAAAKGMLTALEESFGADAPEMAEVLELSLRLAEAHGEWRGALALAGRLKPFQKERGQKGRLERRIGEYLVKIGRGELAQTRFERALSLVEDSSKDGEAARICIALAEVAYQRGDLEAGTSRAEQALAMETTSVQMQSAAQGVLGKVALYSGRLNQARKYFEESARSARQAGDIALEARAEGNLGVVAVQQRRYDEAERRLEEALEKSELPGGVSRLGCWLNLGIVKQRRGDFASALANYERTLRAARRRGDEAAYYVAVHNLATLYQDLGAFDEALLLVNRLEEEGAAAGRSRPWAAMVRAQILADRGEWEAAARALDRGREGLGQPAHLYGEEMILRGAWALWELGRIEAARELLDGLSGEFEDRSTAALYAFVDAAIGLADGGAPDEKRWRMIIEELERLGQFRDALAARVCIAQALQEVDFSTATQIVERGVRDLQQRAQKVPDRFRERFFAVWGHQRLMQLHRRLGGEEMPWEMTQAVEKAAQASTKNEPIAEVGPAYRAWREGYAAMVGEDAHLLQIFRVIDRVAPSETTVLLTGDSGTGKELLAQAVHAHSDRADGPFIKVNCAAFVEELLLSELFGHEKGAFTGAVRQRMGRFEGADGGTIFLDEIGDISAKTQVALLRVLQEGTFERVGGTETRRVNVRVVTATNRNLDEMVRAGTFRLDLYYRLKGFMIEVPPLRKRRRDIPRLLGHFARKFARETVVSFSEEAVQFLARYEWPGNIRELENFVRSVLLFVEGDEVGLEHIGQLREFFAEESMNESLPEIEIPLEIPRIDPPQARTEEIEDWEEALVEEVVGDEISLAEMKKRLELKCIERALQKSEGNISQAARILQMKRPRLSQIINSTPELVAVKQELIG